MANFTIQNENPNDRTGGCGCLCSEEEIGACRPPFVVFHGSNEMDSIVSPVPVLCAGCARDAVRELDEEGVIEL